VGFAAGALMWLTFAALLPFLLDQGISGLMWAFADKKVLMGALWPGGVLGAVVGTIFWVIARPDRLGSSGDRKNRETTPN
jgi:hypothetical protein